ncbi:Crp/Fnr family transcriptional regulator [Paracoccus marcusii]|uniref:Crp/Fnr family transcriptional regulator n=1 Tax=Paracoccus marcusii TaxID=59779 RepID=UPI0035A615D4
MAQDWISQFPGLARLGPDLRATLLTQSLILTVPAGTVVFGPGKPPEHLLLLLDGRVRVQQTSEEGREIVLYRVAAGESCVMTTACLLAHEDYSAEGIAETDVRAAAIPRALFDDLASRSVEFRTFIFTAYARRMSDLFMVIEDIAFQRLDIRLAQKLIELAHDTGQIRATHQQLAAELGTAREVISRQLGEFQRRGWIGQARGVVDLLDAAAIGRLAAQDGGGSRP